MKRRVHDSYEQSSDDSDDSIDAPTLDLPRPSLRPAEGEPVSREPPQGLRSPTLSTTYGIGAKLMQSMGYKAGEGLGVSGQGILEPIEPEQRTKKSGLGSIQPQDIESHPPLPKHDRRLAAVHAEIEELTQLSNLLQTQSASSLDIVRLYSVFGHLRAWQSARLGEVLEIAALEQLRHTPIEALFTERNVTVLAVLKEALLPNRYLTILKTVWFAKITAALKVNIGPIVQLLLDQLQNLGCTILAPALPALSELLATHTDFVHEILSDELLLQQWARAVPSLANDVLSASFRNSLIPKDFRDTEARILCTFLDSAKAARLASAYIVGDLASQWSKFQDWRNVCELKEISPFIWDTHILPLWYDELRRLLRNNRLTVDWWSDWRARFPSDDPTVTSWLLRGLNAINAAYDLGAEGSVVD